MERTKDTASARITDTAMGPTKSPTLPGSRNTGMKPRMVVKVDAARGVKRCPTAARAASWGDRPPARRWRTSSVITTALSINRPMAMIRPKIDIWWIWAPARSSPNKVSAADRGSAAPTTRAARSPMVNSTTATITPAPATRLPPNSARRVSV